MIVGVHGDSEIKVYDELCQVVDEWIEQAAIDNFNLPEGTANKKYSGRFVLRVSEDVHKALWIRLTHWGHVSIFNNLFDFICCMILCWPYGKAVKNQSCRRLVSCDESRYRPSGDFFGGRRPTSLHRIDRRASGAF